MESTGQVSSGKPTTLVEMAARGRTLAEMASSGQTRRASRFDRGSLFTFQDPNERKTVDRRGFLGKAAVVAVVGGAAVYGLPKVDVAKALEAFAGTPTPKPKEPPKPSESEGKPEATAAKPPDASPTPKPTQTPPATPTEAPPTATTTLSPTPPASPTATQTPEPTPTEAPKETVGSKNLAEYLFGDFVEKYKQERQRRFASDPSFRERIDSEEMIKSDRINFLYLGLDQTRDRPDEYAGVGKYGLGRSDAMMFISFDPHTFKTTAISLPRDLLAPELVKYFPQTPKINTVTMAKAVEQNVDTDKLTRQILESATGLPVDGIIRTDIDFMKDTLSALFPEGLEIDVPNRIVDTEYPTANYGVETVIFEKGKQRIKGDRLVKYGRTRHSDSAFGREARQRQISDTAIIYLSLGILDACSTGNTKLIDTMIVNFEQQKVNTNLFFDEGGDPIAMLKAIKQKLQNTNLIDRTRLALNTAGPAKSIATDRANTFTSFGLTTDNGASVDSSYGSYVLRLDGSNSRSSPTRLGNYLDYWKPLRDKVKKLVL